MASDGHELQINPTAMTDQTEVPGADSELPILLARTSNLVTNYVDVDEHQALAVALWVAHTYCIDGAQFTPRLLITAPVKRVGKTTLLGVVRALAFKPLSASSVTSASVFRVIAEERPTLLIDEADRTLGRRSDITTILNAGYSRFSSTVHRADVRRATQKFDAFGPVALAMIGKPEETLLDRSIVIQMRPRRPGKALKPLWLPELEDAAAPLRNGFAMLGQSLAMEIPRLGLARVEGLDDRAADLWSPLLAIASIGGSDLHARAARSAHELSRARTAEADGLPYELLRDLRDLLPKLRLHNRVFTQTLLDTLLNIDGGRWPDMDDGKPLTASSLAKMLGIFDLRPLTVRIGQVTRKGYRTDELARVIDTYAPVGKDLS